MTIVRDHEFQFFGSQRLVCVFALLLLGFSISVSKATSPLPTAASMPAAERAKLERQLTESVQERVNSQKRIEGQTKRVVAKVRLDTSSKLVVVELSRGYVPKYAGGVEDLEGELRTVVEELLMGLVDFSGVTFRYDGRSIQDFHPDPPKPSASRLTPRSATDLVALSPGHGYYFHYGFNDWRPQRDPGVGGLLEDTITPLYAYELQGALGRAALLTPPSCVHSQVACTPPAGAPGGNCLPATSFRICIQVCPRFGIRCQTRLIPTRAAGGH